jgi:hypothetical protein
MTYGQAEYVINEVLRTYGNGHPLSPNAVSQVKKFCKIRCGGNSMSAEDIEELVDMRVKVYNLGYDHLPPINSVTIDPYFLGIPERLSDANIAKRTRELVFPFPTLISHGTQSAYKSYSISSTSESSSSSMTMNLVTIDQRSMK